MCAFFAEVTTGHVRLQPSEQEMEELVNARSNLSYCTALKKMPPGEFDLADISLAYEDLKHQRFNPSSQWFTTMSTTESQQSSDVTHTSMNKRSVAETVGSAEIVYDTSTAVSQT